MLAAMSNRHPSTIKALVAAGLDVNIRHPKGWTPLLLAALNGNRPAVPAALIEAGAHVRDTNDRGETPPMLVVSMKGPDSASLLLKAGTDINARDNKGKTALMHAATDSWEPAMLDFLLRSGADVDTRDREGQTALMHAAAKSAEPARLTLLLQAGADTNARDNGEMTPLLHAAKGSHVLRHCIWMLDVEAARQVMGEERMRMGAESTLKSDLRHTRRADLVELLLQAGADVHAANTEGETALLLALSGDERSKSFEALNRMGVDLETVPGEDGLSYREIVARAGDNLEVVTALLRGGAEPNARTQAGFTPLMRAARGAWSFQLIERLIEFGADLKVRDPEGKTALDYAVLPEVRSALYVYAGTRPPGMT